MKKFVNILFALIITVLFPFTGISQINCTIEIPGNEFLIDGASINPGDVVCMLSGNKEYLLIRDVQGTESQPITIINKGGAIVIDNDHFYGVKFANCKHVIFLGNGQEGIQYGVQVNRVGNGAGMSVDNLSTNIEIGFVEISNTDIGGIYAKTEPYQGDCDNLVTRDNFTMYDLKIHDCYLHDIADEGLYIGSSKYTGQTIPQCNNIVVLPHIIVGVEIYNNILENIGWDGIQIGSSPDDCNIFNNLIRYDSYAEEQYQMSGILIGGGAKCDCYNNQIYDGKGDGIDIFGLGFMKIYNNLIVRAGRTYKPGQPSEYKHGIYIGELVTTPGATFKLYNNTIISPKSNGMKYANNNATMGYIINNLITDPGLLSSEKNYPYINVMVNPQKVDISNNFNVPANSTVKFVNYDDNNFDLKPNSPAVNYGKSLTTEGITFDIENRFRPFHTYFDAGAYECHDPYADINEYNDDFGIPYPVPTKDYINIPINPNIDEDVIIRITSLTGQTVLKKTFSSSKLLVGNLKVDLKYLQPGNYILTITAYNQSVNRPIIIIK